MTTSKKKNTKKTQKKTSKKVIKKSVTKKKSVKKSTKNKSSKKSQFLFWKWFKRVFLFGLILGLIVLILLFLYTHHLYKTEVPKFEGRRWSVPAEFYAQPQELYVGAKASASGLETDLLDLGYKRSSRINAPGDFSRQSNVIKVYVREFQFWDGLQASKQLQITTRAGSVTELKNLQTGRNEAIFRLDPLSIGRLFPGDGEERIIVKLSEVPIELQQGIIAIEDRKFYEHFGIDLKGIVRALIADIKAGAMVQGASTLTQQMVRSYYFNNDKTIKRKVNEVLVTILLERKYEKEELLETYFNEIFMGQSGGRAIHGMGMASRHYFNKPLRELKPHESAVLITLLRGPSYYNPRRYPERVLKRRNLVLNIMHEQGAISEEQRDFAQLQPLTVSEKPPAGISDYGAYLDIVKQQLKRDYAEEDLNTVGLKIFTTLVPVTQKIAEASVKKGLEKIEKANNLKANSLQAAAIITSVDGAEIQALVGGREASFEGFNRALNAKRQIGSLMKPFVYLAAFETGNYSINSTLKDEPIEIVQKGKDEVWKPENYNKEFSGQMPLFSALARSKNVPTVHLGMEVGVEKVMQAAARSGLEKTPLAYPAMMLGSMSLAPIEVAQMYNTLANSGYRTPLRSVRAVLDEQGQPLQRFPLEVEEVFDNDSMTQLNSLLHLVTQKGTGRRLQSLMPNFPVAGKTGTSNDYRDAWFSGFSGDLSTVVWVGSDDNHNTGLTGSSGALPIWGDIMKQVAQIPFALTPNDNLDMLQFDFSTGYLMKDCTRGENDVLLPAKLTVHEQAEFIRCSLGQQVPTKDEDKGGFFDWLRGD